jgi:pimeloyl-ACP methyl ester carboxylesterase
MTDIRDTFPLRVDVVDPVWITMDDGVRLAATLWRPITAGMVPVVVELIPYRRRDGTVFRDVELHPWLAGHGIAYLRVDLRGSGDSDGILTDEYTPREQEDCAAVIAWAADQPWSNGNVGMCGISWGGFNALQLAARQPPALKAIITLCASDDRHSDDVHYMGGAMLTENISWSNVMMSMNALPPDPAIRPDWREIWQARLEANRPWAERWIRHATRDGYWRQGSICEDYSKVKVPVLAAAGWDDSYSNFVLRLIENLSARASAFSGPGATPSRAAALPDPISAGCRNPCAGGGTGSAARRTGSWRKRGCGSSFWTMSRSAPPPRPMPGAGWHWTGLRAGTSGSHSAKARSAQRPMPASTADAGAATAAGHRTCRSTSGPRMPEPSASTCRC